MNTYAIDLKFILSILSVTDQIFQVTSTFHKKIPTLKHIKNVRLCSH